ncbi:MAG TPA: acyltransferase family protein [Bacteroidales bacterium]|nr:acyltransferase family protein [Bacteroidales bacterium]
MSNRLHYIDNLRVFCIIIVVFIHSAVTYSTIGSWYYVEPRPIPGLEKLFFFLFQSHAQAFSMSLFFFIAGYFIPASLKRKGTGIFLRDRLYRLGIPVLIYMLIIHPICVKLVHPDLNVFNYIGNGIITLDILSWSGPLWFALTLLIFSVIYALVRNYLPEAKASVSVSTGKILFVVALIGLLAFAIRLVAPIGTSFMNLQFCFFAAYIVLFYLGTRAAESGMLEQLTLKKGEVWMLMAFAVGLPVWFVTGYLGKVFEDKLLIFGGMNLPSFMYAVWEAFFCVAFIVALFGISKFRFNYQNGMMKFLSDNTFGVYVFHAPVLIAISMLVKGIRIDVLTKFIVVGVIAYMASLLVSHIIRKIPVLGKVFN